MENKRLELHEILCEIINITEPNGDRHVYFQPPESIKMKYPAIRYKLDDIDMKHANDRLYLRTPGYLMTLIDTKPNSKYVDLILNIPHCRFVNSYSADNLNHFTFHIYKK
jgi:hypothetical protein